MLQVLTVNTDILQARVKEMEEEAEKLKELQAETEKTMGMQSNGTSPTAAGNL